MYSFGHSPFLTERDGKRDNGCCSLSNRDKRDVLHCPAERNIVLSAVMILSLACSALAVGQSGRYIGNSTVNGSIYQTYYQVDAQTRTGIKSISVSGTLYEKGTFGTWQRVSNCSNTSTTSNCMASSNYNTKPGKSYKLEYSATFNYSDGRSETITSTTTH